MSSFYVTQEERRNSYEFVEETPFPKGNLFVKWESVKVGLFSTRDLLQDTFYAALFDTKSYYFVSTSHKVSV